MRFSRPTGGWTRYRRQQTLGDVHALQLTHRRVGEGDDWGEDEEKEESEDEEEEEEEEENNDDEGEKSEEGEKAQEEPEVNVENENAAWRSSGRSGSAIRRGRSVGRGATASASQARRASSASASSSSSSSASWVPSLERVRSHQTPPCTPRTRSTAPRSTRMAQVHFAVHLPCCLLKSIAAVSFAPSSDCFLASFFFLPLRCCRCLSAPCSYGQSSRTISPKSDPPSLPPSSPQQPQQPQQPELPQSKKVSPRVLRPDREVEKENAKIRMEAEATKDARAGAEAGEKAEAKAASRLAKAQTKEERRRKVRQKEQKRVAAAAAAAAGGGSGVGVQGFSLREERKRWSVEAPPPNRSGSPANTGAGGSSAVFNSCGCD